MQETGWRNIQPGIFAQIDLGPGTPVAIGIIHVAAAGRKFEVAAPAGLCASPAGKDVRVFHIALERAFGFRTVAHQENLSQVAAGTIKTVGGFAEGCDLVSAGLEQVGEGTVFLDGEDPAFVASPGDQVTRGIESQGVNDVLTRRP